MNLPSLSGSIPAWPEAHVQRWDEMVTRARSLESNAGRSNAFDQMLDKFRSMVSAGRFPGLKELLATRLAARALTWLWLHDDWIRSRLMSVRTLEFLAEAQQPRMSRVTVLQLLQLYFKAYDTLDKVDQKSSKSLREALESHLRTQLAKLPEPKVKADPPDVLSSLKNEGAWLLRGDGPHELVCRVRAADGELGDEFTSLGLTGLDNGRYADVCRAHFYLETLRDLAPGHTHPVMDELLKPKVNMAPFEGERRIGHAALEILIDRGDEAPGELWQEFILTLAGDPRIASSSKSYREWWLPLGEARIARVRGWLSKEDLRLFLQAVEEYGKQTSNAELKRMFPARKVFLEGLYKSGGVRTTRLMLGSKAENSVRRILGHEVKTSFAKLEGTMADKAVIYLDCGDFHLVEGSHSFKIWVYLAQPSPWVVSYDRSSFSHLDLTKRFPAQYKKDHPTKEYESVTHNGLWQRRVFEFLADRGIALDIEDLLTKQDYQLYLQTYGMPVVKPAHEKPRYVFKQNPVNGEPNYVIKPMPAHRSLSKAEDDIDVCLSHLRKLGEEETSILLYFRDHPGEKVRQLSNVLFIPTTRVNQLLHRSLKRFCVQDKHFCWKLTPLAEAALARL